DRFYLEKFNAMKFLSERWRQGGVWSSEVENFQVPPHIRPKVGNVEHLSWSHISSSMAIAAFASITQTTGIWEEVNIWLNEAMRLATSLKSSGFLNDPQVSETGLQNAIFPAAYGAWALSLTLKWLNRYQALEKKPPRTPHNEISGKLIKKSAA